MPYKFVFLRYGLSGGLAMGEFLERQNIQSLDYKALLGQTKQVDTCFFIDCHWTQDTDYIHKLFSLIPSDSKFLMLTRDPISRLKTMLNHGCFMDIKFQPNDTFTMAQDPYDVVNRIGFHDEHYNMVCNKPFLTNALLWFYIKLCMFGYDSMIEACPSKNIVLVDMYEILPDRVFETMKKVAKEFDFVPPKEEDKAFFQTQRFDLFSYHFLPRVCLVTDSKDKILRLSITALRNKDSKLITINDILFNAPHPLLSKIAFSMSREDLESLQQDSKTLRKVKEYMPRFLDELQKRTDYIQRNKKHENDILEIFRGDRDLRNKFKAMLDKELTHIKKHRPDIIESWNYYKEFERICEGEIE